MRLFWLSYANLDDLIFDADIIISVASSKNIKITKHEKYTSRH